MLTNIKQPGAGLWSCDKAAPAKVLMYNNGTASVACESCAASYERVNGAGWVFPLPDNWQPPGVAELARRLAESAREYHMAVAYNDDKTIADGQGALYRNSTALLQAAIANAYPELGYAEIYDAWLDCNETIAYCAKVVHDCRAAQVGEILDLES